MQAKNDNQMEVIAEIGLLVYPDCQLSAVYGLADICRIATDIAAGQGNGRKPVLRASHWQERHGQIGCSFDSHPEAGAHKLSHIIAPPSLVMPADMQDMSTFASWMTAAYDKGATLCSVCAGSFVLGATGLLAGRDATTHWAFADEMAKRFPAAHIDTGRTVIDDGDIITAGGILAWTDLGLTLVGRLLGPSVMLETARFLLVDPPGRAQQPYSRFLPKLDHGDAAVLKVQHWLHALGAKDHAVPDLAERAGLEPRTFLRRFKRATGYRPTEYAQQIRIAKAREALELSRRPVEQIAWDVGYGDASAFRKLFHRVTGLSPADYRQRFGV
jgi:transcriptional regulator GlxA family with amidase domain